MMKSTTLPTSLSVSGQRKKMEYKNGACNYGKLIILDTDDAGSSRAGKASLNLSALSELKKMWSFFSFSFLNMSTDGRCVLKIQMA